MPCLFSEEDPRCLLVLEMYTPYSGVIAVSSAPLRSSLATWPIGPQAIQSLLFSGHPERSGLGRDRSLRRLGEPCAYQLRDHDRDVELPEQRFEVINMVAGGWTGTTAPEPTLVNEPRLT